MNSGFRRHLIRLHAQLFDDDVLYPLVNWFVCHNFVLLYAMNSKGVQALNSGIFYRHVKSLNR